VKVRVREGASQHRLHAQRLDRLPNWDEDAYISASILMNASVEYEFAESLRARLTVDNLADKKPVKDPTYRSYPYYDISWFDSVGRTAYLTINYKFGGQ
jgi:outer membrane receptor protein involved in Fe transport